MATRFLLFCEPCAYKKIIEEPAKNLEEIKRPDIPGGAPQIDPETKSLKEGKKVVQPVMSKCPRCGRGVILKKLTEAYTKAYGEQEKKAQEEKERQKKWRQENP